MPVTIDLTGKLVIITGAGRGLGVDIARTFAEAGANLALTYNATQCDELAASLAKEFGIKAKAFKMPAESSKAVTECVGKVVREMGQIDIVIANAGICIHRDAQNMTDEEFESTFRVNTFSPFYLARAVYNSWEKHGISMAKEHNKLILFVSSMSGLVYNLPQTQVAYNASKAALTMLGKSLAGEWADKNVRVNVLSPGYIATEMSIGSEGASGWMKVWQDRTPLGRFADPKEISGSLLMLAAPQMTFMTGSDVVVDGGYTIY